MRDVSLERWKRLEPILDHALELAPGERAGYLTHACGSDRELRREVDALLRADAEAGTFLDTPPDLDAEALAPTPPGRIGPYRVVREIGRGGMGLVYLAERDDGQFEQRVAVKLIKRGMDSDEIHRRFLAERQILARLSHPHIARLIDGGVTPDGQPWFAMEYVDGKPIGAHCRERGCGIGETLGFFRAVGDAVRYAHSRLVVHRDLKPSNILVTGDDTVKLLDFGIAKVVSDGEGGGGDVGQEAASRTGLRVMTPEYAAPEQVRGEPVTTATDVYALGAVLYELLTGRRAHRFDRHTAAEYERVVCDTDPEAPSRAAGPERQRRLLRGDLDAIVLTALAKEPARRYPSVEAMLEDLRRYESGVPVRARKPSVGYRTAKFVRRHAVGVGVAALVIALVVIGISGIVWQAGAARREAARATAVRDVLVGLFEGADPTETRGREPSARELLERGTRRIDSALTRQPALRQDLLATLGDIHAKLGLYPRADSLLTRALELARAETGPRSVRTAELLAAVGTVAWQRGDYGQAESLLTESLELRRAHRAPDSVLADAMIGLGMALAMSGEFGRAEAIAQEALRRDLRAFGPQHARVARDLYHLGHAYKRQNRYTEADSALQAALPIQRRQLGVDHPETLATQELLANLLLGAGRFAEADSLARGLVDLGRGLYPGGHPNIAAALGTVARIAMVQGRLPEADSLYSSALDLEIRLLGPDHANTLSSLTDRGLVRRRMGALDRAEADTRTALAGWRKTLGDDHPFTMTTRSNLGGILTEAGRHEEAESVLRKALAQRQAHYGDSSGSFAHTLRELGVLLHRTGRLVEAERALRRVMEIYRRELPAGHIRIGEGGTALGAVLTDLGRPGEAEPLLREALEIRRTNLVPGALEIGETQRGLDRARRVRAGS